MKLKKFQAHSSHVTVAYVPTSSGSRAFSEQFVNSLKSGFSLNHKEAILLSGQLKLVSHYHKYDHTHANIHMGGVLLHIHIHC